MQRFALITLATCGLFAQPMGSSIELQSPNHSSGRIISPARKQDQSIRRWRPATFRGLKIGQSTLNDVTRVLGKPKWYGPEADRDESDPDPALHYSYEEGGEFTGELAVIVGEKSKRVLEIRNLPQNLSSEDAVRRLGFGYIIGRYELCPDVDGTIAPMYKANNGEIMQIEYPERGLILSLRDDGSVRELTYVSRNEALRSKRDCKKRLLSPQREGMKQKPGRS